MKHRQKKRILTFLLTAALIFGMIAVPESPWSMVTEVEASYQGHTHFFARPLNPRGTTGSTFNCTHERFFSTGDTVVFNFMYNPQNATMRYGFVQPNGVMLLRSRTSGVQATSPSMTITQTGVHRLVLINESNLTIAVAGSFTHMDRRVNHNARIRFDETLYRGHPMSARQGAAATHFYNATGAFLSTFNINFNLNINDIREAAELDGNTCPRTRNQDDKYCSILPPINGCYYECFTGSINGGHHKSSRRLLRTISSTTVFNVMMVGHFMCLRDTPPGVTGEHGRNRGEAWHPAGIPSRRDSISSFDAARFDITIQHELSHNLGVAGHCDFITRDVPCVTKSLRVPSLQVINTWCTHCSNQIRRWK
jgi:hypothetical protein